MAFEVWQSYHSSTGDISSADVHTCRLVAPRNHVLRKATVRLHNTAQTGTLEIYLKKTDPGDARGGATVGTKLDNDDISVLSNTTQDFEFTLADADKALAPKGREYFVLLSSTNAADRLDEPVLLLEVAT